MQIWMHEKAAPCVFETEIRPSMETLIITVQQHKSAKSFHVDHPADMQFKNFLPKLADGTLYN